MRFSSRDHCLIKLAHFTKNVAALTGQIGASLFFVDRYGSQYLQCVLALLSQQ